MSGMASSGLPTTSVPVGGGPPNQVKVGDTQSALSSSTVGNSVMSTSVLQGAGPITSVPPIGQGAAGTNPAASNVAQQVRPAGDAAQNAAPGGGAATSEQQQNALLKQLLSGNATTTTGEVFSKVILVFSDFDHI